MPANLPAEAKALWRKAMEARSPEDKIKALEAFLSAVPKHKGTEKLVKHIRRRIAELRREVELRRIKERAVRGGGAKLYVEKDGDVQLAVVGPPSSGKTALLKCLTNARAEPDDVPFSTVEPLPGMFIEEDVYFQLVKTPSLYLEDSSSALNVVTASLVRNADGVIVVLEATDADWQYSKVRELLQEYGVLIERPRAVVRIERRTAGGIQIVGIARFLDHEEVRRILKDHGIHHAIVYVQENATIDDLEDAIYGEYQYKPCVLIVNKTDLARDMPRVSTDNPVIYASLATCSIDRALLAHTLLRALGLIRVYTKQIHSNHYVAKPLVVRRGATVGDVARAIHGGLYERFKYAVVWRKESFPMGYKRVGIGYELEDEDVVEIHAW